MKKVIVRQKTGGNEWISFAATIAFLAGSILMIISHFNKKVDATIPILIAFITCTVVVGLITLRLFMTRNVIIEKNNKLIMKGIFYNTVINLDKVEYIKYFQKRNELKIKIKKAEYIFIPKTIDLEYFQQIEKFDLI